MSTFLFECHGHALMDGTDYCTARRRHASGVDVDAVRESLSALQQAGVAFFRDGGDALGVSLRAREMAPDYGIVYRTPAFAIHKAERYGGIVGRAWHDLKEYRTLIAEAKAAGCDFIKLMYSGIITFSAYGALSCPGLEEREIAALVEIAHGEGFAVMAHVNGPETVRAAIEAGTDSIEHGFFMDEDCLHALAASESIWVLTVAAMEAFVGRPGFDEAIARATVERQLAAVRRASELGALVASGSDSGAVGVPHGAGTAAEYRLLRDAGLTDETIEQANRALTERFCRK